MVEIYQMHIMIHVMTDVYSNHGKDKEFILLYKIYNKKRDRQNCRSPFQIKFSD